MKRVLMLVLLLGWASLGYAAEAETAAPTGGNWGLMVWTFVNSPMGLTIIGFLLMMVAGKIFTKKPKWKELVLAHGPLLMQAVKKAEKEIPDDTSNKGMNRLDQALKFLIALEPKLYKQKEEDLKKALTAVHTTAEANKNI